MQYACEDYYGNMCHYLYGEVVGHHLGVAHQGYISDPGAGCHAALSSNLAITAAIPDAVTHFRASDGYQPHPMPLGVWGRARPSPLTPPDDRRPASIGEAHNVVVGVASHTQLAPVPSPICVKEDYRAEQYVPAATYGRLIRPVMMVVNFDPASGSGVDPTLLSSPVGNAQTFDRWTAVPAYPRVDTSFTILPAPAALPSPGFQFANPSVSGSIPSATSELTTPSSEHGRLEMCTPAMAMPIVKLGFGAWKCGLCGKVLRRKHRAVVHVWSKHGHLRLNCQGQCGLLNCCIHTKISSRIWGSNRSFASPDGLEIHLHPVLVVCSSCGKSLLKKNILRHKGLHCPFGEEVRDE